MKLWLILLTAIAPITWGSTYFVSTQFLPDHNPLWVATFRALPAGLLLVLLTRQMPKGQWIARNLVLGALNFGIFFALLFISAYRLPGGVAATLGAIQPLLVGLLAIVWLRESLKLRTVGAGVLGILGIGLLVLTPAARLDVIGIAIGLLAALSMAAGTVLSKRWQRPEDVSLLAFTGWQLLAGGLMLLPVAFFVGGQPTTFSSSAATAVLYMVLISTALAYALWFNGLSKLGATNTAILGHLSPVSAVLIDMLLLGINLSLMQWAGFALTLLAVWIQQSGQGTTRASSQPSYPNTLANKNRKEIRS